MDTNRQTTPTIDGRGNAAAAPAERLILALDRLFKVGPYYPPGHAATRRVTSDFRTILAEVLGPLPSAVFRIQHERLHLLDEPLDEAWPGAADFQDLLIELGIDHLEIDRSASVEDLLTFVGRFLAFRNEVAGIRHFRQMRYEGLPPSVRIGEKHFEIALDLDEEDGTTGGGLDAILAEVEAEAREGAAQESADPGGQSAVSDEPDATGDGPALAENKRPVAQGLEKLVGDLEGEANPDLRARALESAALVIHKLSRDTQQSADHADFLGTDTESASERQVRTVSSDPKDAADRWQPGRPHPQEEFRLSLPELRSALAGYVRRGADDDCGAERDETEHLGVLLQMLRHKQTSVTLAGIRNGLERILEHPLQPSEREICVAGVLDLMRTTGGTAHFKGLGVVLDCFRGSRAQSVIGLLAEVCRRCRNDEPHVMWPFAVNQILQGDDSREPHGYRRLCHRVGSVPVEVMRDQVEWLRKQSALKDGEFSDEALRPPLRELYPIFAVLLETAHPGPIGVELVKSLKQTPPGPFAAAVLPLIDTFRHGYRDFLTALLTGEPGAEPGEELLEAAGRILLRELPALAPGRRDEKWVPDAIRALARLPQDRIEGVLQEITSRRFLLFPKWPAACREAVAETRRLIRRRGLAREVERRSEDDLEDLLDPYATETDE